MRRALRLASRARGRTAPNPMVGAVVVSAAGETVGEGYHHGPGQPHAEVLALDEAGAAARGSTLYVTLEPCAHHGRTPPCVDAIIAAGMRCVIYSHTDPYHQVAGEGFKRLNEAGIVLQTGLLEAEARRLNEAYLKAVETGLPFVTLKLAGSLDGRTATRTGDSRWVTGEKARRYVLRLRKEHDAVLVGAGTWRQDDPLLTARLRGARNPLRVVLDARAELPLTSRLCATITDAPLLVAVGEGVPKARLAGLRAAGAAVRAVPSSAGRLDLEALLRLLVEEGVHSVLCEGGSELAGSLTEAGLVDRVLFFFAPKLVGGREAPGLLGGEGVARMSEALPLKNVKQRRFGDDLLVIADVHRDH